MADFKSILKQRYETPKDITAKAKKIGKTYVPTKDPKEMVKRLEKRSKKRMGEFEQGSEIRKSVEKGGKTESGLELAPIDRGSIDRVLNRKFKESMQADEIKKKIQKKYSK